MMKQVSISMCILSMALSFLACEADDKMDMDKVEVPSGYALSAGTSTIFLNSSIAYDTEASWVSGKYASRFTNGDGLPSQCRAYTSYAME